ncbi:MAG TPA: hypothetical protein VG146_10790 [Verrucomicrobiae bacterium]|nr:hypothetical protein [Verrucomicrobiae bacterium]
MKTAKNLAKTYLFVLLTLPVSADAQSRDKSQTPLRASVGEVSDNRTTGAFNSECKIELKFTGDPAADAGSVRRVRVTEATDELGRDLIIKNEDELSSASFNSGHSSGALKTDVKLRNPSRNATTIKIIKGEVELFNPTEANGGLLTIKNVLQHPAEPIRNPGLAKLGIQVMYLTKETYEAKKKEIDQKAAGDPAGQKLAEAFGGLFKGMFGGMMSDSKNSIQLYIQDPQKRVMDLKFIDGQGKPLKSRERWSSGDFNTTGLDAPPPQDTQLVIQLATPESVKSYPFVVENIPLP